MSTPEDKLKPARSISASPIDEEKNEAGKNLKLINISPAIDDLSLEDITIQLIKTAESDNMYPLELIVSSDEEEKNSPTTKIKAPIHHFFIKSINPTESVIPKIIDGNKNLPSTSQPTQENRNYVNSPRPKN